MGDINWLPPVGSEGQYDLQELDISHIGDAFDLYPLLQYPNLRVLKAAGNRFEMASPLDQLLQLQILDLSENNLISVLPLSTLDHLNFLDLRGNDNIQCSELDTLETLLSLLELHRPLSCINFNIPTITISSPDDTANFFETDPIQLIANANDVEDGNLISIIQWVSSLDGSLGTGESLSASLTAGEHIITASVTDSHGNISSESVNISVLANTAPQLTIQPLDNSEINQGESISLSASAIDNEEGDISQNIQWTSNLDGIIGTGANIQTLLSVGNHIITATITDVAGTIASESIDISVNGTPELSLQSPLNGSFFMLQETVELTATANDIEDGNISGNIHWSSNIDGILGTGATLLKTLSLRNHTLTATISDSAGAISSTTTQILVDQIDLQVSVTRRGQRKRGSLTWSGSRTQVDIYMDGNVIGSGADSGTKSYLFKKRATFKVCESGTNYCSDKILAR